MSDYDKLVQAARDVLAIWRNPRVYDSGDYDDAMAALDAATPPPPPGVIDRTGQRIEAFVPGEGHVSGTVSHSTEAPSHGETQHIINAPDDGRRPIAVRESQIKRPGSPF